MPSRFLSKTVFVCILVLLSAVNSLANDENLLLMEAERIEHAFKSDPSGKSPDGTSLYSVFGRQIEKLVENSQKSGVTYIYFARLLRNAGSHDRHIEMSAYFPRTAIERVWHNGKPGDRFLIREVLLTELKYQIAKDLPGIREIGSLVIGLLYTPGDREVTRLLTKLFYSALKDYDLNSLLQSMNDRLWLSPKEGKAFGDLAKVLDKELIAIYDKRSIINMLKYHREQLNLSLLYNESDRLRMATNLTEALKHRDEQVREDAIKLAILIAEKGQQKVLDQSMVDLCLSKENVERFPELVQSLKGLLGHVALTDHTARAIEKRIESMRSLKKVLSTERPFDNQFATYQVLFLIIAESHNVSYLENLADVLEMASVKGFSLDQFSTELENYEAAARRQLRDDLARRFAILNFSATASSCGSKLVH